MHGSGYFIERDGKLVSLPDLEIGSGEWWAQMKVWAEWYKSADRIVARIQLAKLRVSTVCLGSDHRFGDAGRPLVYETMVFGAEDDEFQWRYCTREAALRGHNAVVDAIESGRDLGFLELPEE